MDFAYWLSFSGGGSAINGATSSSFHDNSMKNDKGAKNIYIYVETNMYAQIYMVRWVNIFLIKIKNKNNVKKNLQIAPLCVFFVKNHGFLGEKSGIFCFVLFVKPSRFIFYINIFDFF